VAFKARRISEGKSMENRLAKVRYFAGIAKEATIAADEEVMIVD